MIHDNIDFHNVAELVKVEGSDGLRPQRLPEHVRTQVDEGTAGVMLSPAGCELRFRIAEGKESASVRLSGECPTDAYVFYGPFQGPALKITPEPKDFVIKPHKRLAQLPGSARSALAYAPGLVRICFGNAYPEPIRYHGHSDEVRLPDKTDTPGKLLITYGSSITHGTNEAGPAISYPSHAAWRLGMDVRNLGASGCCLCEPALADYLAEQRCDVMTLEVSVNMLGRGFTGEEFKQRASYLVKRVAESDPHRPVVCITIFPHYHDIDDSYYVPQVRSTSKEYRQILRDIVASMGRANVSIVEGPELLPDIADLTPDLIHPGVRGMIRIGDGLAEQLSRLISRPAAR